MNNKKLFGFVIILLFENEIVSIIIRKRVIDDFVKVIVFILLLVWYLKYKWNFIIVYIFKRYFIYIIFCRVEILIMKNIFLFVILSLINDWYEVGLKFKIFIKFD